MTRLALALLLAAATARADVSPGDAARATKLFDDGHKLVEAGKIDAACTAFEQSLQLDPQIGTRLNLADCRERQGRLLEAHALFEAVAAEATKANKEGRATFARDRLTTLDGKLGHVSVHAPPDGTVTFQGQPLAPGAQLVMPGPITVDATAPGRKPFHAERAVQAGETVAIEVVLEPLAVGVATRVPQPTRVPLAVTATGAGIVLASAVIGLHARSRWSDAIDRGDAGGVTSAQHEADVATVVAVAGLATAAVGIYLYVRPHHGHVVVAPTADGSSAGMLVAGSF